MASSVSGTLDHVICTRRNGQTVVVVDHAAKCALPVGDDDVPVAPDVQQRRRADLGAHSVDVVAEKRGPVRDPCGLGGLLTRSGGGPDAGCGVRPCGLAAIGIVAETRFADFTACCGGSAASIRCQTASNSSSTETWPLAALPAAPVRRMSAMAPVNTEGFGSSGVLPDPE